MATTIPLASRGFLLVLLAGAFACAGGDLVLPDPPGGGENVELSKFEGDNGDNQEAIVGEQLPKPLVVQVLTAREQPAIGRRVEFVVTSPADAVGPDTAITNSQGLATAQPVLGTSPGDYLIEARLVAGDELQTEQFRVAAKPASPDTLSPLSPVSQPGRRSHPVATPPKVRVVDRFGNPVPEVLVAWQVTAGEGQTTQPITRTGSDGTTTVDWTLGNRIGVHKLTATIEQATGSPATFTVTVFF
jgi:hypothetical protein